MIYKPNHESATAFTSLLVHTVPTTPVNKGAQNQDQSNQHQLAPINNSNQQ